MSTLAIILLIIIIGSWLFKRLMPYLLLYIVKHVTNKQFGKAQEKIKKEGNVNVISTTSTKKKIAKDVGEYVEFKEII